MELITVQAVHDVSMISVQCFNAAGESVAGYSDLSHPLYRFGMRLRADGDDRPFVLELSAFPSERTQLTYSFDLPSLSPARMVWDRDFRYPGHPLPGRVDSAGAGQPRPTDPDILAEVRTLLAEFADLSAVEFPAGYSEEEIADAEAHIGLRLPEDLRALYQCLHDDVAERRPLGWFCPQPLDTVVADYLGGPGPGSYGWDDDLFGHNPVVLESFPYGTVKRVSRSDRWVTFGTDFAMNYCAVDLDPGPAGVVGQVIEYGRDTDGPVRYVAPSVLDMLRRTVADLRAGIGWSDDHGLRGPQAPQHSHVEAVGSRRVADLSPHIQQIHLNDADGIDLDALAPLHRLRVLSINRAAALHGHVPRDLPIEALRLHADRVDLDALAGHPTLWALTVKSSGPPVDIATLASLPNLVRLDLSGAEILDVERVVELPNVRVLVLNPGQWRQLRTYDVAPAGLAAAELSGYASLADAIDWAAWLTGHVRPGSTPPAILTFDASAAF